MFFRKKKEQRESTDQWVFEALVSLLNSPLWTTPILDFIDHNCIHFDTSEENKFIYTEIHQNFRDLIDSLLSTHLEDLGLSHSQFVSAVKAGNKAGMGSYVFDHFLAAEDFLAFKKMMVRRNLVLEEEVFKMLQQQKVAAEANRKAIEANEAALKEKERLAEEEAVRQKEAAMAEASRVAEEEHRPVTVEDQIEAQEQKMLEMALKASEEEFNRQQHEEDEELQRILALTMKDFSGEDELARIQALREEAEMEQAVAMSLAMDAEKARLKAVEEQQLAEQEAAKAKLEKEQIERENVQRREVAAMEARAQEELKKKSDNKTAALSIREIKEELAREGGLDEPSKPKPVLPPPSVGKLSEAETKRRQAFFRAQRDRLLLKKSTERGRELQEFSEEHGVDAPKTPTKPKRPEGPADAQAQALRFALTRRLCNDMKDKEPK